MINEHFYPVNLSWKDNRKGELSAPEISQKIEVVTPPEFPKGIPGIWSPEHLFTASVSSCLMTTFLSIAENSKLEFVSLEIKASGKLEMIDGKYMMSEIHLLPELTILHKEDIDKAEKIINKSESVCLISNSIKSKIVLNPIIKVI